MLPVEHCELSCKFRLLPADRNYHKGFTEPFLKDRFTEPFLKDRFTEPLTNFLPKNNICRFFPENYSTTDSSAQGNRSDGNNGGQVLFKIILNRTKL
jgi:hypothetical protein